MENNQLLRGKKYQAAQITDSIQKNFQIKIYKKSKGSEQIPIWHSNFDLKMPVYIKSTRTEHAAKQ